MTIKDIFSGIFKKNTEAGWKLFFSSSSLTNKKTEAYYFGIIFSATDAIAKGVQNVDYGLFEKKGGEWEKVEKHPALDLLQKPNVVHSDRDLLYMMSSHVDLYGQSFMWPVRTSFSSKNIVELRLLKASQVETVPDIEKLIKEYKWTTGIKTKTFQPEELINVLRPDPTNMINGLSTIGKARYEGDNELNSQKLNASFYENGGLPSGAITTDAKIDPKTFQSIKMRIKQQYEGVKNAYKMMFLTHGMKYQSIQPTQRDMEYVSQRKLNRDQILAIFQVPKSLVAVSEQVNRATAEVEVRTFMRNVVEPRLKMVFAKLNRFYLPLFDGTENMEFRFTSPVPEDKEFMLTEKIASNRSWRTPNEIREEEGREPIDGGDDLDTPFSFGNLDTSSDEDDSEDDEPKDKKTAVNKALDKLVQACDTPKHGEKGHVCEKIEELPRPSDQKLKQTQEYNRRRNSYTQSKEKRYALELLQHLNFFISAIKKAPIKKAIEDDVELLPEKVEEKLMPPAEKVTQWKTMLYLMILKNNSQIWNTAGKQLKDVYKFNPIEVEGVIENFVSDRANFTAKSVSDTLFKKIRSSIDNSVKAGEIDLKKIKRNIISDLGKAKDWKVEQIARTELAWSYSESQMKTYANNKVEKLEWVCGLDACEICDPNCGKVVELNKTFPSGNISEPAHINCRCMVVPV